MTGNIVIFVTDQRQSNLAACLPGKIHRLDWRRGVEKEEALEVLDNSRYLVLPVPVTKIERNHDVNLILKEELTGKKERDWILFGGVFGPEWRQRCEDAGTEYYDMMTDADSFVANSKSDSIDSKSLQDFSSTIYNIALQIGIGVAVVVGLALGIQFMLAGVDGKADVKKALIAYVVGCIAIFGAFGVWKLVIEVMQQI